MDLFRYATSVYGEREIIGGSFDLHAIFLGLAGVAAILAHALFKWVVPSNNNAAP